MCEEVINKSHHFTDLPIFFILIFNHGHVTPLFGSLDPMKITQCIISHDAYSPLSGSRWLARVTRYPVFAQNMGGELPEGNQTT